MTGSPVSSRRRMSRFLSIAPPPLIPFEDAELSPMGKTFWADNRRVRNDRIKKDLGVELAFPDYRVGMRAVLGI